ncbi:hypothetical protein JTB14_009675 [Gonioctena quinquepunctata]|nr:hypothetical protein JTB14_009675 [Gonioctena quinquepunctata]
MNKALVSVIYNEWVCERQQLASYAIQASGNGNIPLSKHSDTDNNTIAATDNFDHRYASRTSGTYDAHDRISFLFQPCSDQTKLPVKPKVSEINSIQWSHYLQKESPCERVVHYNSPISKPWFPESFKVKDGLFCNETAEKYMEYLEKVLEV